MKNLFYLVVTQEYDRNAGVVDYYPLNVGCFSPYSTSEQAIDYVSQQESIKLDFGYHLVKSWTNEAGCVYGSRWENEAGDGFIYKVYQMSVSGELMKY